MNLVAFSNKNINEYLITNRLVLVDFFSEQCSLSMMCMPILDRIALDMKESLMVGTIDIDDPCNLAADLGVRTTPSLILFKNGAPVAKMSGFRPASQIRAMISDFM
jgi:thioredoxin-like negative regulator of GroEL